MTRRHRQPLTHPPSTLQHPRQDPGFASTSPVRHAPHFASTLGESRRPLDKRDHISAGVIETRVERDRHQDALGVPLAMCRLIVDLPLVRARLARRHEGEGAVLQWHLARSGELDTILEAAAIEDFTVSATDLSISSTAKTVLSTVGWQ